MPRKWNSPSTDFHTGQEENWCAWSEQRFYKTLLCLFRPDRKSDEPLRPPFYKNRPLSAKEFECCQAEYGSREKRRIVHSWRGETFRQIPDPKAAGVFDKIHDLVEREYRGRAYTRLSPQGKMKAEKAHELWKLAGKAVYADTAKVQTQVKRQLRAALRGRPTPLNHLCRELLDVLPQIRARLGTMELFTSRRVKKGTSEENQILLACRRDGQRVPALPALFDYRAARQFLWVFLREEARYGIADWKNLAHQRGSGENPKVSLRDSTDADLQKQAEILWKSYPYLELWNGTDPLGVEWITSGLKNSRIADKETALKFGKVEASTLRKTISLLRPRKHG